MKKTIFACLMLSALAITGCNTSANAGGKSYNDGFTYSNDALFNSTLAINNIIEPEFVVGNVKTPTLAVEDKYFDEDDIYSKTYLGYGLLVLKNDYGNIGFYSLIANDFILERQFQPKWLSYEVVNSHFVSFYLVVRYEDNYKVIDSFGNKLYEGTDEVSVYDSTTPYYAVISKDGDNTYYRYDKITGKATITSAVIDDTDVEPEDENDYTGPFAEDPYREDWEDLTPYGLDDYSLVDVKNGLYYVYDENHTVKTQFYVDPETCRALGIVGQDFYYQQEIQLSEDATQYKYSSGNNKYSLATYSVNLLTGKKSTHEYLAKFSSLTPLKDENDDYVCYILEYNVINKDFVLAEKTTRIIDPQFRIHDDLSGLEFRGFVKLKNSYFNFTTKVLYDSELKPITWLGNLTNLSYKPNMQMFVGKLDGKWGMVDLQGKVSVEFRFNSLYPDYYANSKLLGEIDGYVYRLGTYDEFDDYVKLGSGFVQLSDNLYRCTDDDGYYLYFSSNQNLYRYNPLASLSSVQTLARAILGNYTYSFITTYYTSDSINYNRINYTTFRPQAVQASVKGAAVAEKINSGIEEKEAVKLELGYNKGHFCSAANGQYFEFTPETTAYYSLYTQYSYSYYDFVSTTYLNYIYYYDEDGNQCNQSTDTYTSSTYTRDNLTYNRRYVALLEQDVTYYFVIWYQNITTSQLFNLFFEMERGNNQEYPMIVKISEEELEPTFTFVMPEYTTSVNYVYVKFRAPVAGYYDIEPAEDSEVTFTTSNYSGGIYDSNKGAYAYMENNYGVIRIYGGYNGFESNFDFQFTYEEVAIPVGFSLANPYVLEYGSNSGLYNNPFSYYSLLSLSKVYIVFEAKEDGTYIFSESWYTSSSYYTNKEWKFYDEDGEEIDASMIYNNSYGYYLQKGHRAVLSFEIRYTSYSVRLNNVTVSSTTGYSYENPADYASSLAFDSTLAYYAKYVETNTSEKVKFALNPKGFGIHNNPCSYQLLKWNEDENDFVSSEFKNMTYDEDAEMYLTEDFELELTDKIIFRFNKNVYSSDTVQAYLTKYLNEVSVVQEAVIGTTYDHNAYEYDFYTYTNNGDDFVDVGITTNSSFSNPLYFLFSKVGFTEDTSAMISCSTKMLNDNVVRLAPGATIYLSVYCYNAMSYTFTDDFDYYVSLENKGFSNKWYAYSTYENSYRAQGMDNAQLTIHVLKDGTLSFSYCNNNSYYAFIVIDSTISTQNKSGGNYQYVNDIGVASTIYVTFNNLFGYSGSSYYSYISYITFTPANA